MPEIRHRLPRNRIDHMVGVMVAVGPRKDQNAKLHSLKNIIRKQDEKNDHGSRGSERNKPVRDTSSSNSRSKKSPIIRVIRGRPRLETNFPLRYSSVPAGLLRHRTVRLVWTLETATQAPI